MSLKPLSTSCPPSSSLSPLLTEFVLCICKSTPFCYIHYFVILQIPHMTTYSTRLPLTHFTTDRPFKSIHVVNGKLPSFYGRVVFVCNTCVHIYVYVHMHHIFFIHPSRPHLLSPLVILNLFSMSVCAAVAKSLQSCPTLCDPTDDSPPGSPVPGILQATVLEWVAIAFSVSVSLFCK